MTEYEIIRSLRSVKDELRNAYSSGFEDGQAQGSSYECGYEDGASQLWELVCRIAAPLPLGMTQDEIIEAFGCAFCDIFDGRFSYQDIVLRMKAYDEKKSTVR